MDNLTIPTILLIVFGLIPSFIWLLIFLRKDAHPESNGMILKVFFWGALATLPTVLVEMGIEECLEAGKALFSPTLLIVLKTFVGVAFVEEIFKYLVVKGKALKDQEFDEPTDAMLYMIIAGLGFAGLENILALFPFANSFSDALEINIFRFLGAIFLHALCSGTIGYFLALSFRESEAKKQIGFFLTGVLLASFLHGLFNFSIINMEGMYKLIVPTIILIGLGAFVFSRFRKLKNMPSVCKI